MTPLGAVEHQLGAVQGIGQEDGDAHARLPAPASPERSLALPRPASPERSLTPPRPASLRVIGR
ncbi:hypothetical protein GCM10010149_61670 [Nonomuraea roseoviolacea subsp. roseoviolacea]